jgi:hypothetical protein
MWPFGDGFSPPVGLGFVEKNAERLVFETGGFAIENLNWLGDES